MGYEAEHYDEDYLENDQEDGEDYDGLFNYVSVFNVSSESLPLEQTGPNQPTVKEGEIATLQGVISVDLDFENGIHCEKILADSCCNRTLISLQMHHLLLESGAVPFDTDKFNVKLGCIVAISPSFTVG